MLSTTVIDASAAVDLEQERLKLDSIMEQTCTVNPAVQYYPAYDKGNIKAITFDGMQHADGNKTRVFAYIGYPADAKAGDNLPAVVLVHGGGGHAFSDWVKYWNNAGYVAIAMDNTGFFPNGNNWVWGLSQNPDFAQDGYSNVPQCDSYNSHRQAVEKQWMYHAVGQTILARNILQNDACVDASKVGVTGISWGGKVAAMVLGYAKFAFAAPQYCSGYLSEALTHNAKNANLAGVKALWTPEDLFDKVDYPVLWMQWTKDSSAAITSTSLCYLNVKDSVMSLRLNWFHGHDWNTPIEIVRFADSIVKGGEPLTKVVNQPDGSRNINFAIAKPGDATKVTAKAVYITEKLSYKNTNNTYAPEQTFKTSPLTVEGDRVTGTLPEDAYSFYVEISTVCGGKTYYTATAFLDVDTSVPVTTPEPTPVPEQTETVTDAPTEGTTADVTPTATAQAEPGQPNTGAIIGICAGVAVIAAAAAVLIVKKRKAK